MYTAPISFLVCPEAAQLLRVKDRKTDIRLDL